jgi:hypothetical protein
MNITHNADNPASKSCMQLYSSCPIAAAEHRLLQASSTAGTMQLQAAAARAWYRRSCHLHLATAMACHTASAQTALKQTPPACVALTCSVLLLLLLLLLL